MRSLHPRSLFAVAGMGPFAHITNLVPKIVAITDASKVLDVYVCETLRW